MQKILDLVYIQKLKKNSLYVYFVFTLFYYVYLVYVFTLFYYVYLVYVYIEMSNNIQKLSMKI